MTLPPPQRQSMKPNSIKTRFAYGFLRALKSLRKDRPTPTPTSSSSPRDIFRRRRIVKLAADASMASAVGPRRVWSRVVLWKIRCQAQAQVMRRRRRRRIRRSSGAFRRRVVGNKSGKGFGTGRTDDLRKLVPGGETMDLCSLLDETAHYIKCLTAQMFEE
ncbi:hypothetical protein U1Q18_033738 [Sarracenia purpurea var. burkii]